MRFIRAITLRKIVLIGAAVFIIIGTLAVLAEIQTANQNHTRQEACKRAAAEPQPLGQGVSVDDAICMDTGHTKN